MIRLPKGGPDGLKLARQMCGQHVGPDQLWELVLYALPPVLDEFPAELFVDDEVVWHQQQFGLPGQVATASVIAQGNDLYVATLVSDVVQRIGWRRDLKTRIEKRFKGWSRLCLNAVLDFARDRGASRVFVARADWARQHTDGTRDVQRAMFERVYDGTVGAPFCTTSHENWWVLDVRENAATVVPPVVVRLPLGDEPQVFVCHDVERGWGHFSDTAVAARMDAEAPAHLDRMLDLEADAGVRATYCLLGILMSELAARVRSGRHAIAFHSFDHAAAEEPGGHDQLRQCRDVDYRIKGYRPAQSRLTGELTDDRLAFHNFEWLASSRHSLQADVARLANGIVRIPILFDDFDLYKGTAYESWEASALRELANAPVAAFSLHDCYGDAWLGRYRALLAKLADLGAFRTLDDLAADVLLRSAV